MFHGVSSAGAGSGRISGVRIRGGRGCHFFDQSFPGLSTDNDTSDGPCRSIGFLPCFPGVFRVFREAQLSEGLVPSLVQGVRNPSSWSSRFHYDASSCQGMQDTVPLYGGVLYMSSSPLYRLTSSFYTWVTVPPEYGDIWTHAGFSGTVLVRTYVRLFGGFGLSGYQSRDDSYTRPGVPDELKWQPVMRGFPEDVEVLTEIGWVLFSNLYRAGVNGLVGSSSPLFDKEVDWSLEHKPLRENWVANKGKHQQPYEFAHPNEVDFTKWRVGSQFPRVATLSPDHMERGGVQHGRIVFERPVFATRFLYHDLQLVHLKRRGVDLLLPRYTDILAKNKFQSQWNFSVADDFCVVRKAAGAYKSLVNRYSPAGVLHGDVDADRLSELSLSGELRALMTDEFPVKMVSGSNHAKRVRIWDGYPYPRVRDTSSGKYVKNPLMRNSIECYNLSLAPGSSHTLFVRRAGHVVEGEKPQTSWTGYPVVVGDGYDKSSIPLDRVNGLYKM